MIQTSEPFVRLGKANLETALTVADITLESAEQLVDLQLKTAKDVLAQSMRHVHAFSEVRNVQDFVALQSKAVRPDLDKALAYSRDMYAVATHAQERIGKVLKSRLSELGGEIMTAVDHAAKSTPGTDTALAALQSTFAGSGDGAHTRMRTTVRTGKSAATRRPSGKRKAAKK
jgi:phasin family protein